MAKTLNIKNWALAAAAGVAALLCVHRRKIKGQGGIGHTTMPASVLNEAKAMFDAYDLACEIDREHDKACDAIYEDFLARGIDPFADENARIVVDALYHAGLTDKNGMTDVTMNRHNARKELLNFINNKIITLFPIPASDRELLRNTRSYVYQEKLLDLARDFVNKQLKPLKNIGTEWA